MKILLDNSPAMIEEKTARFVYAFGQLRTPLTAYRSAGVLTGIDNGCFSGHLDERAWMRIVDEHRNNECLAFVAMPDVVADARRTLELFDFFEDKVANVPRALVAQDGQENLPIPWDKLSAVFIGGTDAFKDGPGALAIAKAAKILNKWVHVGRVNSVARIRRWKKIADSCDGSGLSRYDTMLANALKELRGELPSSYEEAPSSWGWIDEGFAHQ
jgi:hypothetical protein